jgi:hypothetical protein
MHQILKPAVLSCVETMVEDLIAPEDLIRVTGKALLMVTATQSS